MESTTPSLRIQKKDEDQNGLVLTKFIHQGGSEAIQEEIQELSQKAIQNLAEFSGLPGRLAVTLI